MNASLKLAALGMFLLVPFGAAHAQSPSLSPIPNVVVNAGATATVNVTAVDADGRAISLTSSLPAFGTLNTPTSGDGVVVTTLTFTPSEIHVGGYSAAVTATAGGVTDIELFQITVNAAGSDQPPTVSAPPLQEVAAGSSLTFLITAGDPDGDAVTSLTAAGLPLGATFTPDGAFTSGQFTWTPTAGDAGEYDILFTASNALSGTAVTHIRVGGAPALTITPIADVTVEGGSSISVPVHATGVAGEEIILTASLPSFATLNSPGTGVGSVSTTITVSPPVGSAGTYHASLTATSLENSVTEAFDIIVTGTGGDGNHPPVLTAPASQSVEVGSTLSFNVTATDQDGDHVDLSGTALPPGAGFVDNGDNTGTFSWSPVTGQGGIYVASFTGLDGRGGSGSASTVITVTGDIVENQPPTVVAPASLTVDEGNNLSYTVTATDPDGDTVALSTGPLPSGASFADQGGNSGIFSWTPDPTQAGTYEVGFIGDDGNGGTGTASTTITVQDVVEEPICSVVGPAGVCAGTIHTYTVTTETPGVAFAWSVSGDGTISGPATGPSVDVEASGTGSFVVSVTVTHPDELSTCTCSMPVTIHEPPVVTVNDVSICPGGSATLTASATGGTPPFTYLWSNGGTTSSITATAPGTYSVTVTDANGCAGMGSGTVTTNDALVCGENSPRTAGFWSAQCAQRGNGSTKFTAEQLTLIAQRADDRSSFLDWAPGSEMSSFCALITPPKPMDQRKQALRQYAAFLANMSAGELGLVPWNGELVSLNPETAVSCGGLSAATLGELVGEVDAILASLDGQPLSDEATKSEYGKLISCLDAINNGHVGAGTVAEGGEPAEETGAGQPDDEADDRNVPVATRAAPNPFRGTAQVAVTVLGSESRHVQVRIVDAHGRLVRTLANRQLAPGRHEMRWDGADESGRKVATGVYYIHSTAEGRRSASRLVYIR